MTKTTIDLRKVSAAELEELMKQKKAEEQQATLSRRKTYEKARDGLIDELGAEAKDCHKMLLSFKAFAMGKLSEFRQTMIDYGELRNGEENKGNFKIRNGNYIIEFSTQERKAFDERAELAASKLQEFTSTFLKKKAHKNVVKMINALLEKRKNGDYDINLINRLYAIKDDFTDPNWVEALELFQQSYRPVGTAQYARFAEVLPDGSTEALVLDFAKLKSHVQEEETEA